MPTMCPECHSRAIGEVANGQWYCWDCCIEFDWSSPSHYEVFEVDADGGLSSQGVYSKQTG